MFESLEKVRAESSPLDISCFKFHSPLTISLLERTRKRRAAGFEAIKGVEIKIKKFFNKEENNDITKQKYLPEGLVIEQAIYGCASSC